MATGRVCGKCGAPLTAVGHAQLCPGCLLEGGLASAADAQAALDCSPIANQEPAIAPALPRGFGDYELLEEIARGGMGVVYKARQASLDRIVAVKMLLFGPLAKPEFVQRFRAEAAAAASLHHPNIVAIHEVGFRDGQHFFAMDYVEGLTLAQIVANGPLPARRAAGYLKTVAEAIHFAHERNILHRDLKPSNVLIDAATDQPRVTDFGLAKRLEKDTELTLSGQVLGSPNYMPPEQAAAHRGLAGKRSDVYSLGAILYHLVTGRAPFVAETVTDTLQLVQNSDPVSPRALNPSVPRDLETICLKCLEKEPGKRYSTAQALADDVGRLLSDEPIQARPVSRLERAWRWCRRKPVLAALTGSVLVTFGVGFAGVLWQWRRANQGEVTARRNLYAADMKLAVQAWELGEIGHARALLERHRPKPPQPDLRGFEWRLLWGLSRREELFTLPGADVNQCAVGLSPDGQLVAVGLWGELALWDLSARQVIATLKGHSRDVGIGRVAFSPDGRMLASASGGLFQPSRPGELILWDVPSRTLITNLTGGHSLGINGVAFSSDGQVLASGGADQTICLWNVNARQVITKIQAHTNEVRALGFSPTEPLLASASSDRTIKLWKVPSGQLVHTFEGPIKGTWSLAFSPDGTLLASGGGNGISMMWQVASRQLKAVFPHRSAVCAVAFSPGGQTLACGIFSQVILWNLDTMDPVLSLDGLAGAVEFIGYSPGGRTLVTGGELGMPKLWNVDRTPSIESRRPHADGVTALAISPDEAILATGSGDFHQPHRPCEIKLSERVSGRLLQTLTGHQGDVMSLVFSPNGKLLASGSRDRTVRLWDVTSGRELRAFTEGMGETWSVDISPDGRTLAFSMGNEKVGLWDLASGQPLPPLLHSHHVDHIAFSPRGRWLASTCGDKTVKIWDLETREVKRTFPASFITTSLAFSRDGILLAAGTTDKTIQVWEVASGRELATFAGHQHVVEALAFSPDRKLLASGCVDNTIKLWNLAMWQEVATLRVHRDHVFGLAFTGNGQTLISASRDKTLRLWHAPSFAEIDRAENAQPHRSRR